MNIQQKGQYIKEMKRMTKNEKKEKIKNYCKNLSEVQLNGTCKKLNVDVSNFRKCRTTLAKMELVKEAMSKSILEIVLQDEVMKDE